MKNEKRFQIPEAEVVLLTNDDIITDSDVGGTWPDLSIPPYPNNN